MKKIPFDIKYRPQVESGKYKVVTRIGKPVRIICWDLNGPQPIVGTICEKQMHQDIIQVFDKNGKYWKESDSKSHNDLFIITDEPELTEFEEELRQVIVSVLSGETPNGSGGTMSWAVDLSDDDIRKLAPKVMELAKKEICKGCTVGLDQYWKGKEDARKEAEKSYTFQYPPYYPPCRFGGICTNPFKDCINCSRTGGDIGISTTSGTCKRED